MKELTIKDLTSTNGGDLFGDGLGVIGTGIGVLVAPELALPLIAASIAFGGATWNFTNDLYKQYPNLFN